MDRLSKILLASVLGGVITLCVGTTYIPQVGGTVPPNKSPQEFNDEQQYAVYNSSGFKITMIGTGITFASIIILYIRSCMEDYRVVNIPLRSQVVRSILKVKRVQPETQVKPEPPVKPEPQVKPEPPVKPEVKPIEIIVEDPKPQVRTTPNLTAMVPAPSSSPPPQLIPSINIMELRPVPRGPVIEKIPLPVGLRKTFKYPPPYDVMNR